MHVIINHVKPISLFIMSFQESLEQRLSALDSNKQDELRNLWKVFGLESEAGKRLFLMYNSKDKLKAPINYPKPKPKQKLPDQNEPNLPRLLAPIECSKLNSVNSPGYQRNPKIYSVPKRRNHQQIDLKNAEYFKNIDYKLKPGVDRFKLIEELQRKFKFANSKVSSLIAVRDAVGLPVGTAKGKSSLLEKQFMFGKVQSKDEPKQMSEREELSKMFDDVIHEVEEGQRDLELAEKAGDTQLVEKIKWEIVEKVSDLEKITKLLRKSS